ncbi:hypothetical protein AQUCO_01300836v1 [Aquilegia coerulea]|uniref:F-box domain-containing protein n=1 Tax=Aquilegia coerulea TaxID=218851 RepID=A0A2G5E3M8_AQUCA|nr:hypothetical protein AQUCO_01300836v1 [Aquilegia coerulea]
MRNCFRPLSNYPSIDLLRSLPKERLVDILSRLPLKTLISLKCVSWSWRLIIEDSTYIDEFYRAQRAPIVVALNAHFDDDSQRLYSIDGNGLATLTCMFINPHGTCYDSKSCSGLFCFPSFWSTGNCLRVCNPATQEVVTLPRTDTYYDLDSFEFGFNSSRKEYKVLAWTYSLHYEVFTLGTNSWRAIRNKPAGRFQGHFLRSFCMNGSFYWYCDTKKLIISFNLAKEKFGQIHGPKRLNRGFESSVKHLFELDGCLCLVDHHYLYSNFGDNQSHPRIIDLWMLKDYNKKVWKLINYRKKVWVKMTSITLPSIWMSLENPFSTRTGEILIARSSDGSRIIYLYSLFTQKFTAVNIVGLPSDFVVTNYAENSVRLKD